MGECLGSELPGNQPTLPLGEEAKEEAKEEANEEWKGAKGAEGEGTQE